MAKNMREYINQKAQELDLERGESLAKIQAILDRLYPGQARAKSLNQQVLKIITPNASLASELRLRQSEIIKEIVETTLRPVNRLHIQITTL
jgi:hypothetical protein